ncbi:MAG: type II toxin-antitoxin system RelE family toxin [Chloroflexota bacterium]
MSYAVLVSTRAAKDLADLPASVQRRVRALIDRLATEPRPRRAQALAGVADSYRVRVGDYRVVYAVDDAERQVVIARVGHRRDVYRRL